MPGPIITTIANSLWYLSCLPEWYAFRQAQENVAQTQRNLLHRLLDRNANTQIGQRYNFAAINSIIQYQKQVPLSSYDDYRTAITNLNTGYSQLSTNESALLLKFISGTAATSQYVPHTASLKTEFQRALSTWVVDLFTHHPHLLTGPGYWSITPVAHRMPFTLGGVPIGFEEDSDYENYLHDYLLQTLMAVPASVRLIEDIESFRYVTLLFLLRSRRLALMSVWHPTFLTLLMERLQVWWPRLVTDIRNGTLTPTNPLSSSVHSQLAAQHFPDYQRAAEIRAIFTAHQIPGRIHRLLWPNLRLISCWADTQAKKQVDQLQLFFPRIRIQEKGVIANEGFISLPLFKTTGAALALRSHFFEFLPVAGGPIRLAHELEVSASYEVVITTGGGLYRYQLHDIVQVVGKIKECPLLHFLGKSAHISNWFGENLNEQQVRKTLENLITHHGLNPSFVMMACDEQAGESAYTLFIEIAEVPVKLLKLLAQDLEIALLKDNFHYRYCRELKQLGPLRVFRISRGGLETYLKVGTHHGQSAGEVKLTMLHQSNGWSQAFRGQWLE